MCYKQQNKTPQKRGKKFSLDFCRVFSCCSSREYNLRREADILELEQRGQKRVCFGNDMEKMEEEVMRICRLLRVRADRRALRRKVRADPSAAELQIGLKPQQLSGQPQNPSR